MAALIKSVSQLLEVLQANKKVDNSALAPGNTEARQWLRDFKASGYVQYQKCSDTFILAKPLPEEILA